SGPFYGLAYLAQDTATDLPLLGFRGSSACVLLRLCGVMLHMHEHDDDHAINHIAN
uniref:Uncharacterized protein n=1 Tax=Aegilops tauschii subsp. strangulata TaxID=200361 RepID=A0A453FI76_AEGTS